jgi:hypothetical protein
LTFIEDTVTRFFAFAVFADREAGALFSASAFASGSLAASPSPAAAERFPPVFLFGLAFLPAGFWAAAFPALAFSTRFLSAIPEA